MLRDPLGQNAIKLIINKLNYKFGRNSTEENGTDGIGVQNEFDIDNEHDGSSINSI